MLSFRTASLSFAASSSLYVVVEPPTGDPPLWIDERDRKGRPVEPTVKEAAGRI